jgi:hypothetical protein
VKNVEAINNNLIGNGELFAIAAVFMVKSCKTALIAGFWVMVYSDGTQYPAALITPCKTH